MNFIDTPEDNLSTTAPIRKLFHIDKTSVKSPLTMKAHHYHDAYEIYYLCSGERYYFIHDRIYRIQAGDLVLIDKHIIHRTLNLTNTHDRIVINFHDNLFEQMPEFTGKCGLLSLFEKPVLRLNRKQKVFVETLLHKMLEEYQSGHFDSDIYNKLMLAELLLSFGRYRREQIRTVSEEHPGSDNPMFERISVVADYINGHYAEPLSLELLAALVHINHFYLSRLFKRVTGFSVIEYIKEVRLKEAQKLLQQGKLSITKVAETVGFDSSSHFGRVFKSSIGMSPRDYRKTNGDV